MVAKSRTLLKMCFLTFGKIVFRSLSNISIEAFVKMVGAIIGVLQYTKYASVICEPLRTNALTHT